MNPKQRYLEDVQFDKSLKLSNGKTVHGLEQLPMVVKFSDDEVFSSHVSDQKNDFADWINDALGYRELADKVRKIGSKEEFIRCIDQDVADIKNFKEPEVKPDPKPEIKPEAKSGSSETKAAPEIKLQNEKPEVKPEAIAETAASEIKPAVNPEIKPAVNPEIKPEAKSEEKPKSDGSSNPIPQSVQSQPAQPVLQSQAPQPSSEAAAPFNTLVNTPQVQQPQEKSSENQVTNPVSAVSSDEKFDYEEIFKVLLEELEQETYSWENTAVQS